MTPAQEALKAYIITKIGEGIFAGARTPLEMMRRITAAVGLDGPVVLKDMLNNMAESGVRNLGLKAFDKFEEIARDIAKRGIGSIWADLQAQYDRGRERNRKG